MQLNELDELHYICPISNLRSVLTLGILSHRGAENVPHVSVAMDEIQDIRTGVQVPGGRPLHEYVNLYFCGRNPMMSKRRASHTELLVLRISTDVLQSPEVVISDQNAASKYARFARAPGGLAIVNRERVFADDWRHPDDLIDNWRHSSQKCAEVLVPDRVGPGFIEGAYVSGSASLNSVWNVAPSLPVTTNGHLFFR